MFGEVARRMFGAEPAALSSGGGTELTERPRIGLALGGGAARGFAHIGVLRAFEAAGLAPDVIAGTSIGAVVGGCYAAGKLDEFEAFSRSLSRRRIFSLMDFSLSGSGLIGGERLLKLLDEHIGELLIEELPFPFLAIASELKTGHEIWLSRGRLVTAMRASYALPGMFSPVKVAGRWLVDGALVNPVPVSPCRALGARIVIAVNLSADTLGRGTVIASQELLEQNGDEKAGATSDIVSAGRRGTTLRRGLFGRSDTPGVLGVMFDAFNIIQDRITRSRLAGDPPDVNIGPRLNRIGLFDFDRADEAIALGREAGERALDQISESVEALR